MLLFLAQIELLIQTIAIGVQFSFLLLRCHFHDVDQRADLALVVCDSHVVIRVALELALAELTALFGALSATVWLPGVNVTDVNGGRV